MKSGILKLTQNLHRRLGKYCSTKQEQWIADSWLAVRATSARNFITVTKRRLRTRRVAIAQVYRYCCSCTPFHALRHCDDPQLDTASTQFSTRVSPIFPHTFASLPHPLNNIFSVPTNARICNLHEQTHCMMDTRSIHSSVTAEFDREKCWREFVVCHVVSPDELFIFRRAIYRCRQTEKEVMVVTATWSVNDHQSSNHYSTASVCIQRTLTTNK